MQCQFCDQTFRHSGGLKIHVRSVHEKIKDYHCKLCDKSYTQSHSLKNHIKIVHEGVKAERHHKCVSCDKVGNCAASQPLEHIFVFLSLHCSTIFHFQSYTQAHNLKRHIRLVHEGQSYKCDFCEKAYSTSQVLKRHIKTVHGSNDQMIAPNPGFSTYGGGGSENNTFKGHFMSSTSTSSDLESRIGEEMSVSRLAKQTTGFPGMPPSSGNPTGLLIEAPRNLSLLAGNPGVIGSPLDKLTASNLKLCQDQENGSKVMELYKKTFNDSNVNL